MGDDGAFRHRLAMMAAMRRCAADTCRLPLFADDSALMIEARRLSRRCACTPAFITYRSPRKLADFGDAPSGSALRLMLRPAPRAAAAGAAAICLRRRFQADARLRLFILLRSRQYVPPRFAMPPFRAR